MLWVNFTKANLSATLKAEEAERIQSMPDKLLLYDSAHRYKRSLTRTVRLL